jgi:hypothetical protein
MAIADCECPADDGGLISPVSSRNPRGRHRCLQRLWQRRDRAERRRRISAFDLQITATRKNSIEDYGRKLSLTFPMQSILNAFNINNNAFFELP